MCGPLLPLVHEDCTVAIVKMIISFISTPSSNVHSNFKGGYTLSCSRYMSFCDSSPTTVWSQPFTSSISLLVRLCVCVSVWVLWNRGRERTSFFKSLPLSTSILVSCWLTFECEAGRAGQHAGNLVIHLQESSSLMQALFLICQQMDSGLSAIL